MKLINKCLALFVKPKQKPNKELLPIVRTSSPACTKPHVGSRFSSCRSKSTDKHWSEMSGNEKIEAGPFLCFVNPDEFDKKQGKFVEFMILYNDYDEYIKLKEFAIESGRWAELEDF